MDAAKVTEIIEHWGSRDDMVIEMMHDIQSEYRYIPREAIELISKATGVPMARLFHVGTFYNAFTIGPRGKFHLGVCVGAPFHVKGAGGGGQIRGLLP